jgi:hypothetical protein
MIQPVIFTKLLIFLGRSYIVLPVTQKLLYWRLTCICCSQREPSSSNYSYIWICRTTSKSLFILSDGTVNRTFEVAFSWYQIVFNQFLSYRLFRKRCVCNIVPVVGGLQCARSLPHSLNQGHWSAWPGQGGLPRISPCSSLSLHMPGGSLIEMLGECFLIYDKGCRCKVIYDGKFP